jgi:hypothetical protein
MRWPHFPIVHLLTELILGYLLYWFLGFNPVLLIVITALLLLFWIGSLFMGQLSQAIRSMGLHVLILGVFYLSCSAYYQPSKNHFTSIEHPHSKLPVGKSKNYPLNLGIKLFRYFSKSSGLLKVW